MPLCGFLPKADTDRRRGRERESEPVPPVSALALGPVTCDGRKKEEQWKGKRRRSGRGSAEGCDFLD